MRRVLPVLLAAALAACRTEPNPAYCDDTRPCGEGTTCEANACVSIGGGGADAGCATECGGGTPYCVAGSCVACRQAVDCPGETPMCGAAGACEPCLADDQCAARPDGTVAGLCTPGGACVLDDDVVLVDGEAACGAVAAPFCQIGDAVVYAASAGLADVLVMATTVDYQPFEVDGATVRIYGKPRSEDGSMPAVAGVFGGAGVHVIGASADVELHRLIVKMAGGTGKGIHCENAARCALHRVVADRNGFGVYMDDTAVAEVVRSTIVSNNSGGIWLGRVDDRAVVVNNFIYRNGSGTTAVGGLLLDAAPTADVTTWRIASNSLLGNTANTSLVAPGVHCNQPMTVVSHVHWGHAGTSFGGACAVQYSSTEVAIAGTGNIAADPMFVSVTPPEDLHIQMVSPCRNAGPATSPSDDIDGDLRDGAPDMGADEFH
jgi:hypothetical protein